MKVSLYDSEYNERRTRWSIKDSTPCVLGIDASTTNTGITVLTEQGELKLIGSFTREPMRESPVRYKILLKEQIYQLLGNYRNIKTVVYEEPCVAYVSSVKNLYMLRSMVEEILIEHEDTLQDIEYIEVPSAKWKRLFLAPQKNPQNSDRSKAAISDKVLSEHPELQDISQDEKDSYGIASAYTRTADKKQIRPDKSRHKFLYLSAAAGTNTADPDMAAVLSYAKQQKIPQRVISNGVEIIHPNVRHDIDAEIRGHMQDTDKLLVMIYPSDKVGSLALKFRLGGLIDHYRYIMIYIWRKNRKRMPQYTV